MDLPGANGIEHVDDHTLIISSATLQYLYKYDLRTRVGAQVALVGGAAVAGDCLIFDSTRTTLFVTNGGGAYAGQISALRSSDGWASAEIVINVPVGCGGAAPATATVPAGGFLYTYCAAGFGAG
eukprot:7275119-Prymnesium_polylepis.1